MTHNQNPPLVLHILDDSHSDWESIARILIPLFRRLRGEYRFRAVFLDGGGGPLMSRLRAEGVDVRAILWNRKAFDWGGARYILEILDGKPDLIHAHTGGRSLLWLSRLAGRAPVLCQLYSRLAAPNESVPKPMRLSAAHSVIAVSESVASLVRGSRVRIIHPGVDLPVRQQSKDPLGEIVVGSACRLTPSKGLRYLLRAFARTPLSANVRLEMTGSGPDRSALEDEACRLGIETRVRFLGWVDDVQEVMTGWDIFVHPTLEDALPIAILDAMASGLPVLASRIGDIPVAVLDGETGFLVPPADDQALSTNLEILLSDSQRRETMGNAARQRVRDRFGTERMTEAVRAVYAELIGNEKR